MAALHRTLARRPLQIGKVASAFSPALSNAAPVRFFLSSFRQRRPLFQPAIPLDRLSLRVGGKIRERIRSLDTERIRLGLLLPPPGTGSTPAVAEEATTAMYLKRAARALQIDAARARLRAVGASCIARSEFFSICNEAAGGEKGDELAQSLDSSGAVIVWDDVVFLRPEELSKAIESVIPPHLLHSRRRCDEEAEREELATMEKVKAEIDRSAAAQVRSELWCGLGFLAVQTAAFARLTFWELSWDVMEPICFYVTSVYFMAGYTFFLRTSKEPSFKGFFEGRFATRQKRLMEARQFDIRRFHELIEAFGRRGDLFPPASGNCQWHASSHCHCLM